VLSNDQLRFWNDNGYLVLEDFVDRTECERLRDRAFELVTQAVGDDGAAVSMSYGPQMTASDDYFLTSGDKVRLFFEEKAFTRDSAGDVVLGRAPELAVNKVAHAMHDLDPVFDDFSHGPELAAIAGDVGMTDPRIIQSMYIFKQPDIGAAVNHHCDHTFLATEPQSVVGFWFAIEDATLDNGCLEVLPGGHRLPVPARFRRDGAGSTRLDALAEPYPDDGYVPLEVEAGAMVVLHGTLPHHSRPNCSSSSRHAYTLHAVDGGAEWLADNWLQRSPDLPLRGFDT
jgi:phytanoyl-CoA hydroxylase